MENVLKYITLKQQYIKETTAEAHSHLEFI